jgi:hypothetical protein
VRVNGIRCGAALLVLVTSWVLAGAAAAQGVDLTPSGPGRLALGGELGFFTDRQHASSVHLFVPRVSGHYALDERWSIAGDLGLVLFAQSADSGPGDDFAIGLGNPTAFAMLRGTLGALAYRVGLGGAAPLARVDREGSGRLLRVAYNDAQAMRGLADLWLFAPSRGAVIAYGELEGDLHEQVQFELEASPALLIPAYEAFLHDSVALFIPTALTLSTQRGPVRFGLRFQAVFMPADDPDVLQLALEPQLRVVVDDGFVELRYLANIDEPLGGERGPRRWGLHLAAGGTL